MFAIASDVQTVYRTSGGGSVDSFTAGPYCEACIEEIHRLTGTEEPAPPVSPASALRTAADAVQEVTRALQLPGALSKMAVERMRATLGRAERDLRYAAFAGDGKQVGEETSGE